MFPAQLTRGAACERVRSSEAAQHYLTQDLRIGVARTLGRCQRFEEGPDVLGVTVKRENVEMFCGRAHTEQLRRKTVRTSRTADGRWFDHGRSETTRETTLERRAGAAAIRQNVIVADDIRNTWTSI